MTAHRTIHENVIVEGSTNRKGMLLCINLPVIPSRLVIDVIARVGRAVQRQWQPKPISHPIREDLRHWPPISDTTVVAEVTSMLICPPVVPAAQAHPQLFQARYRRSWA